MSVFQWFEKLDIARCKFRRQCIGIRDDNECVPAGNTFLDVSLVVRQWSYANGFEQDLRTAGELSAALVEYMPSQPARSPSR